MASLFVIQGRDQGKRFDLRGDALVIGRDAGNPIQLRDTESSRRHAEIRREQRGFDVVDLGSSNGTFVNGKKITRHTLQSGDRLQVGRTLLIFTAADDPANNNLLDVVDIVGVQGEELGSRIVRSVGRTEEEQFSGSSSGVESPWLARARSNLQVMYRTALAVSHTLDIDQLLDRIMQLIFEWVEVDRGCIMLVDNESGELTPKVRSNRQGVRGDDKMTISRTILDYVMEHREGVLTSDAQDDARFDAAGSIMRMGVREAICVPLQGRYGIVGVIYIDTFTPPGKFVQQKSGHRLSEEHLQLMVAIGHQAALAVEDTSYYSAMVQAERLAAIGQTIATLSHHIKNILQGIRGGSYLIEEGLKGTDATMIRKGWGIVDKNQDKISHLVMDMLSFSKEREPELAMACLNDVVAEVVELCEARAADNNVALRFEPCVNMPSFMFDAEGLHRAILNVVTNAIDACVKCAAGEVAIETQYDAAGRWLRVLIRDNGEGIEADRVAKIFALFESRKGARGTGLGLPVSQKILREHGGDILVESQLGQGSLFTLQFPAFAKAEQDSGQFSSLPTKVE